MSSETAGANGAQPQPQIQETPMAGGENMYNAAAQVQSMAQSYAIPPPYIPNNSGYYPYQGMEGPGLPVDPNQMQAAAFMNQSAIYGQYGAPYPMAAGPPPMFAGNTLPMAASFYGGIPPFPGPSYYDPYGMLNPAACVSPIPPTGNKSLKKKKEKRCFGCC